MIGSVMTFLQNLLTLFKRRKKAAIKYICPKCHAEEMIPQEALEYFDAIDPERMLVGPPTFRCEKCDYPYMQPEQYEAKIMGFGLYEGLDYTIKSKSKAED